MNINKLTEAVLAALPNDWASGSSAKTKIEGRHDLADDFEGNGLYWAGYSMPRSAFVAAITPHLIGMTAKDALDTIFAVGTRNDVRVLGYRRRVKGEGPSALIKYDPVVAKQQAETQVIEVRVAAGALLPLIDALAAAKPDAMFEDVVRSGGRLGAAVKALPKPEKAETAPAAKPKAVKPPTAPNAQAAVPAKKPVPPKRAIPQKAPSSAK
jgi:hypothetical protein